MNHLKPKEKKKLSKPIKVVLIILLILFILATIACGLFEYSFSKMNVMTAQEETAATSSETNKPKPVKKSEEDKLRESLSKEAELEYSTKDITNILLVGVDNDNIGGIDKRGDADGLILLSINNKTKKIAITSILREVYLDVEPEGNEATLVYHYYGLDTLIKGLEDTLNIKIDNYMLFNYLDIIDIIDKLGGVDIDIYNGEVNMLNQKIGQMNFQLLNYDSDADYLPENAEGKILLNGKQTAAYMRIRLSDQSNNDFGRTQRIRNVIMAMKDKALSMSLTDMYSFANETLPNITTDLSRGRVLSLLVKAADYRSYAIVTGRIPVDGSYESKNYAQYIDLDTNRQYLLDQIS